MRGFERRVRAGRHNSCVLRLTQCSRPGALLCAMPNLAVDAGVRDAVRANVSRQGFSACPRPPNFSARVALLAVHGRRLNARGLVQAGGAGFTEGAQSSALWRANAVAACHLCRLTEACPRAPCRICMALSPSPSPQRLSLRPRQLCLLGG